MRSEVVLYNYDKGREYLGNITKDGSISIDDFWESHVESGEGIKNNLHNMKTPIFIKENKLSMASPPDMRMFELLQVGFDKKDLADKLNL